MSNLSTFYYLKDLDRRDTGVGYPVILISGENAGSAPSQNVVSAGSTLTKTSYPELFQKIGQIKNQYWYRDESNISSINLALSYGHGLFVRVGQSGHISTSTDSVNWTTRSSSTSSTLNAISYGNGFFVASGDSASVVSSTNGITWIQRSLGGTTSQIRGAAYGNGRHVVVGSTGLLFTSTDGVTWANTFSDLPGVSIGAVTYGNGQFTYVADNGAVGTSTNGLTWSAFPSVKATGSDSNLNTISYGNGIYVATGESGRIRTSTDLVTWTARTSGTTNSFYGAGYGQGRFVTVGSSGVISDSTDGITWNTRTLGTTWYRVLYDNGVFHVCGESGYLAKSYNGIDWDFYPNFPRPDPSYAITSVVYGNGVYVAGTYYYGKIYTSTNAITWTQRTTAIENTGYGFNSGAYGNGRFVLGGYNSGIISYSTDNGVTWTTRTNVNGLENQSVTKMIYSNGQFTFISGNKIGKSTNGVDWDVYPWTYSYSGFSNHFRTSTFGNGIFVAAGDSGQIGSSANGITWTARTSGTSSSLITVIYNTGTYITSGAGGVIRTSTDGTTWTGITSPTATTIRTMIRGNNLYVLGGDSSIIFSSTDAITWTQRTSGLGTTSSIYGMTYGNGRYVACGHGGFILSSDDAVTWTPRTSNTTSTLQKAIYANGRYLVLGYNSTVRSSTDGITWESATTPNTVNSGGYEIYDVMYYRNHYVYLTNSGYIVTSNNSLDWQLKFPARGTYFNMAHNGNSAYLIAYNQIAPSQNSFFGANTSGTLYDINYANNAYYVVGDGGLIRTSTDTVLWSNVNSNTTTTITSLDYKNNLYLMGGSNGLLWTSTDAITWNSRTTNYDPSNNGYYFSHYDYYKGHYVAMMNYAPNQCISTSTDGINWNQRYFHTHRVYQYTRNVDRLVWGNDSGYVGVSNNMFFGSNTSYGLYNIHKANNEYFFVGNQGTIYRSPDAVVWSNTSISKFTTTTLNTLIYKNGNYIVGGHQVYLATSTDLITWQTRSVPNFSTSYQFNSSTIYRDQIVFASDAGRREFATSTDGIQWTPYYFGGSGPGYIYSFLDNAGTLLYAGNSTEIGVSRNHFFGTGTSWGFFGVVYGNGRYVAVGRDGIFSSSTDNIFWTTRSSGNNFITGRTPAPPYTYHSVAYGNGLYVAGGYYAFGYGIASSTDAITWEKRTFHTSPRSTSGAVSIMSIIYQNGLFMAGGYFFDTFTSTNLNTFVDTSFVSDRANTFYVPNLGITSNNFVSQDNHNSTKSLFRVYIKAK